MASAGKKKNRSETIDTGIQDNARATMAQDLSKALADSYTLYLKTLGVHWNVTGPTFFSIHQLTEEQYQDLHAAADAMAERIRALGHMAPASYKDFDALTEIAGDAPSGNADAMIDALVADNETCARRFRDFVGTAEEVDDVFTADMLTARIGQHEKNAWMLRALRG